MQRRYQQPFSISSTIDHIGFGRYQWLLLFYVGLAWAADAMETMLLSYLGPAAACAWPETVGPARQSLLSSVVFIGMLIGVYSLGIVSDFHGRKQGFLLSASLLGIAGLASSIAPSFGWLLFLRCIVGFALGGTPIAVTLFAEFVPTHNRGRWLLAVQLWWSIGTMFEAILAWVVLSTLGWRWFLALSAFPLLPLTALYPWLPESPHWLAAKGRISEAKDVVRRIAAVNEKPLPLSLDDGENGDDPAAAIEEISALVVTQKHSSSTREEGISSPSFRIENRETFPLNNTISIQNKPRQFMNAARASFSKLLSPELRRTTLLLWVIWFVNALMYYGLVLLTTALQTSDSDDTRQGVSSSSSSNSNSSSAKSHICLADGGIDFGAKTYIAVLITTLAEAPGLVLTGILIDTKGRRWTLQCGLLLCSAAMASLVFTRSTAKVMQIILLFIARAAIEGTFSTLYVYTPELYGTLVRSIGLSLCNALGRIGGLLAPFVTVYLVETGRSTVALLIMTVLCLVATGAALMLPIETKGRDLHVADSVQDFAAVSGEEDDDGVR